MRGHVCVGQFIARVAHASQLYMLKSLHIRSTSLKSTRRTFLSASKIETQGNPTSTHWKSWLHSASAISALRTCTQTDASHGTLSEELMLVYKYRPMPMARTPTARPILVAMDPLLESKMSVILPCG